MLVTGASSGLGRSMTEIMAAEGYFVYAGARKDKDIEELNAIENVQAVRLDVTKQHEIDAAVKTITDAGRGLYGLVNNAGVLVLEPLIIESHGRIAIIGSISGVLSSSTWGPYSMTKHAKPSTGRWRSWWSSTLTRPTASTALH